MRNTVQEIIETTSGIHWAILDASGVIVAVNPAWRTFSNQNGGFGDYLGCNYLDICTRAVNRNSQLWEASIMARSLRECLDGRQHQPQTLSYSCHAPREHRWFEATLQPCDWENQKHLLVIHRNITSHKMLEISRERAMGMMLHDLRNHVGNSHNMCNLLLTLESREEQHELLRLCAESTRRALDIITTNTRFAALERGALLIEPEELDLIAMIALWNRQQKEQLNHRHQQLEVTSAITVTPPSPKPRGERHLIQSMLDNLLNNAMEAAPNGSVIRVRLTIDPTGIHLIIRNPGAVPILIRSTFFDKYVTWGKPSGTGLGTYSARLIVEAHRGTIRMTTPDEESTEIHVQLPHLD
ncbi:MAG: HAMP domain-containing histidine kinase [Magnetococcales bacterium]|nr:HAMP domain-containing histidine kinase [Magnetococcales bacterium]